MSTVISKQIENLFKESGIRIARLKLVESQDYEALAKFEEMIEQGASVEEAMERCQS